MLIQAHDEWQVSDRRYLSEQSMTELLTHEQPTLESPTANSHDTATKEVDSSQAAAA